MLSLEQVIGLARRLDDRRVLSMYVDGRASDPAAQRGWRKIVEERLAAIRETLAGASHAEREELERCIRRLEAVIAATPPGIGGPGFIAFVTEDATQYAEAQPLPMPTLVAWRKGALIAPYMRALKEDMPAFVALVNSRQATLYRYARGRVSTIGKVHAHHSVGDVPHMGAIPRRGFHVGTPGRTGTEAAARAALAGRTRMMHDLAGLLAGAAPADGWVVIGGTPKPAREAYTALAHSYRERMLVAGELAITASEYEIAAAAAVAASTLRRARDTKLVASVIERTGAGGRATLGAKATRAAVAAGAVHELFLTRGFVEGRVEEAEAVVRAAIDERARIEIVSGPAAELLDAHGQGIGALLRFAAGEP